MRYTRTPTTAMAVSLDDLLVHMRTGFDAATTDATTLMECQRLAMTAAREIEAYCDIALTRQTISLFVETDGNPVHLPVGPLAPDARVTVNGTEITTGITGGRYPVLTLPEGITGSVAITYEAGFADTSASVPDDLQLAVMDQAAMLFDYRALGDERKHNGLSPAAARICAR